MNENIIYIITVGDFIIYANDGETPLEIYENRCLSASFGGVGVESSSIPWDGTEYNPWDYKYEEGEFVLDPIEIPEAEPVPTEIERINSKIDYIAMMTDVELPEEV